MRQRLTLVLFAIALCSSAAASMADNTGVADVPASDAKCRDDNESEKSSCKEKRPRGRFILGAWLTPDDGFTLGAAAAQDRLFGSDHGLKLSASLSGRRQDVSLAYKHPSLLGSGLALELELHDKQLAYDRFSKRHTGGSVRLSRKLASGLGMYLGYRLDEASALITGANGGSFERGIVAGLRAGLTFDKQYSRRRHTNLELFVERSSPWLGSDYDFVLAGANANIRQPLIGPFVLHVSGDLQALASEKSFALPVAERLQHEGHANVRGFGLGSFGGPVGGTLRATGRAELEFPLITHWGLSGALFYDAGLLRDEHRTSVAQSVGGSVILKTPVGPLRVDLALPLDGSNAPQLLLGLDGSF